MNTPLLTMKNRTKLSILCTVLVASFLSMEHVHAAYPAITLRYQHFIFTIDPDLYPQWQSEQDAWFYFDRPIEPLASWLVDGDEIPALPVGIARHSVVGWDHNRIAETLHTTIGDQLNRDAHAVTISRTETGSIVFDGVGLTGRRVMIPELASLVLKALEQGVTDIVIPVEELPAQVTVQDAELLEMGIKEVITVGESDYSGSPFARRHNITTGLSKFNGHIIPQGETFSFNQVLGPVNRATGYLQELVILGERTIPDFGGGLCQVSSTAYRGIWEYGFPIAMRKNHSYAVRYYSPNGTDATIYPPNIDMKFVNDSLGALLIQTYEEDDHAYFVYYGTHDDRTTDLVGPFTWDHRSPPPPRTEYTADILAGTTRKVGTATPGLQAAWFRIVHDTDGTVHIDPTYSFYEARPLFTQIGVAQETASDQPPSWLNVDAEG